LGRVQSQTYRVADLRKFPELGHILGFKDNKRYKPDKKINFTVPVGWISEYAYLQLKLELPEDLQKQFSDKVILYDGDRPLPEEFRDAARQATCYRVVDFHLRYSD
ncbi:MAG: hypothetical protein NTW03_11905, partial [Verrucomicrobia bacterium]|nr:hypothetical protein [Verrucomicrobiota bacterium]